MTRLLELIKQDFYTRTEIFLIIWPYLIGFVAVILLVIYFSDNKNNR